MPKSPLSSPKPQKPVEQRLSELEQSVEGLLSTIITITQTHTEAHTAFVHEIARLKEEVAILKKRH